MQQCDLKVAFGMRIYGKMQSKARKRKNKRAKVKSRNARKCEISAQSVGGVICEPLCAEMCEQGTVLPNLHLAPGIFMRSVQFNRLNGLITKLGYRFEVGGFVKDAIHSCKCEAVVVIRLDSRLTPSELETKLFKSCARAVVVAHCLL